MGIARVEHEGRSHQFGRHDRLTIDGATYRVVTKKRNGHLLQLVIGDVVQDHFVVKTDAEINRLIRKRRFAVAEGFYSHALARLRMEHDNADLAIFDDADLRGMAWKAEWCIRFNRARVDIDCPNRPSLSLKDMAAFIEANKRSIETWYIERYCERRPLGRKRPDGSVKEFDYPEPGALREWLQKWKRHGEHLSAFVPHYGNCGNRQQIDPRAEEIVERCVAQYARSNPPLKVDIYEDVETDLDDFNRGKPVEDQVGVGFSAVLRRINKLEPFKVRAGRKGVDSAIRKYTPVGYGLDVTEILHRVEIDDWEMDLFALVAKAKVWKNMTAEQRKLVPRVRCTATVAIDVASRAIVGFNLTKNAPSPVGSKSALRSVLVDKSGLARWAGAQSPWPMQGRPFEVATDGGPAFQGDFAIAASRSHIAHALPEQDPRMRGFIEAFFRLFRRLCRYFAGQAFSNVVEKGDYDAQGLASLTVDELYRLAVRFIVDHYHHRKHRGVEGRTPFAVWTEKQAAQKSAGFFSEQEIISSFGIRAKATIDKHGVLYMGNSYQGVGESPNRIAALHRILPNPKVDIIVDPCDLKTILVRVPKSHVGHPELGDEDFVFAECLEPRFHGRTLESLLAGNANVCALAKREEAAGRSFRLGAHRAFRDEAEMARVRAGHREYTFTQDDYDRAVAAMNRKGRAALEGVDYGAEPLPQKGSRGTTIAVAVPPAGASGADAAKTRRGSINSFGEDEQS